MRSSKDLFLPAVRRWLWFPGTSVSHNCAVLGLHASRPRFHRLALVMAVLRGLVRTSLLLPHPDPPLLRHPTASRPPHPDASLHPRLPPLVYRHRPCYQRHHSRRHLRLRSFHLRPQPLPLLQHLRPHSRPPPLPSPLLHPDAVVIGRCDRPQQAFSPYPSGLVVFSHPSTNDGRGREEEEQSSSMSISLSPLIHPARQCLQRSPLPTISSSFCRLRPGDSGGHHQATEPRYLCLGAVHVLREGETT